MFYIKIYRVGHLKCHKLLSLKVCVESKMFRQKLCDIEEDIRWYHRFDLWRCQSQGKITLNFLNETPDFSLHILAAYLESFSQNTIIICFLLSTFWVIRLENYNTTSISITKVVPRRLYDRIYTFFMCTCVRKCDRFWTSFIRTHDCILYKNMFAYYEEMRECHVITQ